MLHKMGLQEIPFNLIRTGTKTIELRLYDDKRKQIQVGDTIEFSFNNTETVQVRVIGFVLSDTFENLFRIVSPHDAGFETADDGISIMQMFYPLSCQYETGVIGIKIKLIQ